MGGARFLTSVRFPRKKHAEFSCCLAKISHLSSNRLPPTMTHAPPTTNTFHNIHLAYRLRDDECARCIQRLLNGCNLVDDGDDDIRVGHVVCTALEALVFSFKRNGNYENFKRSRQSSVPFNRIVLNTID